MKTDASQSPTTKTYTKYIELKEHTEHKQTQTRVEKNKKDYYLFFFFIQ